MHLFSRLVGTNSLLNLIGVGRAGKQRFSGSNSDLSCKTYKVTVRQGRWLVLLISRDVRSLSIIVIEAA